MLRKKMREYNKGAVFVTVIIVSMLTIFIVIAASSMILQDTYMIKYLRYSTQALFLAESGISEALARLVDNAFSVYTSATKNLGEGTYNFNIQNINVSGVDRWLITSVGTVNNVSRTVTMEVKDVSSPMMNNALSAGTNITLKANQGDVTISGDIHANNDLLLKEQGPPTALRVLASEFTTGKATSSNNYSTPGNVSIADAANSGGNKPKLGMPIFNFTLFKQTAISDGNYIDGDFTFPDGSNINGGSAGITYVNGDVIFTGSCTITGGFVAKGGITLNNGNSLTQAHDAGNRFPIFMSEEGNRIKLYGLFSTAEGNILYATNDIQIETPGGSSVVAGTVIAGGSFTITANNDLTITYGRITASEVLPLVVEIVSWNR